MDKFELAKRLSTMTGMMGAIHALVEEPYAPICEHVIDGLTDIIHELSGDMDYQSIADCPHIWKPLQGTHERFCPLCGERDE